MEELLILMIKKENKYKPFTDEELAQRIHTKRESITELRKKLQIPNSRDRLNAVILKDAQGIYSENKTISHRDLMKQLNDMGYDISRAKALDLIGKIRGGEAVKHDSSNTDSFEDTLLKFGKDPFEAIIGCDRSMKIQIRQAKAAVLYPPMGLHTLILGPSGVGKSMMADLMHKYAVSTENFSNDAPFITFNCADYADNPQLLISQLFGHAKGAFSGASESRTGLVEKADGGILFLDEIHRLPSEGQEILFHLLDRGEFRRLGETDRIVKVRLMIIGATTEKIESSLLLTFRRRIPMVIEIPPIHALTLEERFEIISSFFQSEAKRIQKNIIVDQNSVKALMLYRCPGNIGQIRSDIQVSCAKALLNALIERESIIKIHLSDLANHVRLGLLDGKEHDFGKMINGDLVVNIQQEAPFTDRQNRYIMPNEIYHFIENRTYALEEQGFKNDDINLLLSQEVESKLMEFVSQSDLNQKLNRKDLKNIVGAPISEAAEACYRLARDRYKNISDAFYYSLAIHLSATYERLLQNKKVKNPEMRKIKEKYPEEFELAAEMGALINKKLMIELSEEEIGFITMYLKNFSVDNSQSKRVTVIVLTHGKVGTSIVEVVNRLLNTNHAIGIEMSLDENPKDALARTLEIVKESDQGRGTILMVDMGSLTTFADIIARETGIDVRVIERADTLKVLEVTRRALLPNASIDDILHAVAADDGRLKKTAHPELKYNHDLPEVIVSICMTGEGAAKKIEEYVENLLEKMNSTISVVSLGVISPVNIDLRIRRIMDNYNVIACVGTINPEIQDVPFISIQSIYEYEGINRLKALINGISRESVSIGKLIDEDLIFLDQAFANKNEAIDFIVKKTQERGYVMPEFLLSVYKRESMTPTYIKGSAAIPHGLPQYVTKPVIAIARLVQKVSWMPGDTGNVDLVFLIAYKDDSKKYFRDIYINLLNTENLEKIRGAADKNEIISIIKEHVSQ